MSDEYEKGFKQGWYDYFSGEDEFPPDDNSAWMKGYHAGWAQGVKDEEFLREYSPYREVNQDTGRSYIEE